MRLRVDTVGVMKIKQASQIALEAASLSLDIEHGSKTQPSPYVHEVLADFPSKWEQSLSPLELDRMRGDIVRTKETPRSLVYAGWAGDTLANIWRNHR